MAGYLLPLREFSLEEPLNGYAQAVLKTYAEEKNRLAMKAQAEQWIVRTALLAEPVHQEPEVLPQPRQSSTGRPKLYFSPPNDKQLSAKPKPAEQTPAIDGGQPKPDETAVTPDNGLGNDTTSGWEPPGGW